MDLTEKTVDSREVFKGRIIRVRLDTVRLPNGKESTREVVEHPGGVGILAIDGEGRVLLVRQYRYALGQVLTEIPAGKREPGEPPFVTAQRELQEEVGAVAGKWTDLGTLIASLASLITFREYVKHNPGKTGRYLAEFSAFNFGFLFVLIGFMTLLKA